MVELVGLNHHLQEGYQILVKVSFQDAQTRLHYLNWKLNNFIEIHELLDDIRDKHPDFLEKFDIRILLALRKFLALLEEMTN